MVSFLFWNLDRNPLKGVLVNLARRHRIDVLMLAECSIQPSLLLTALNQDGETRYQYAPGYGCKSIQIFTRFSRDFVKPRLESDRLTIRHLTLPGLEDILLAVVHFPSKRFWNESSQTLECVRLADEIRDLERRVGHTRTVLVGDLNMNPFEDGVVGAKGLHGVMSRDVAQRGSRVVQSAEYPFFYNPMWSFFGDSSSHPPGTYYYDNAEQRVFFWNIFDQILVRPDLLKRFHNEDLAILSTDGVQSLLSDRKVPDSKIASDHLPLVFSLSL